ncbi:MAG: hypothetical protein IID44_26670 [Planctomycetes bacterium]|nr:hypothetical protein [Planctomycetota bacterium]
MKRISLNVRGSSKNNGLVIGLTKSLKQVSQRARITHRDRCETGKR